MAVSFNFTETHKLYLTNGGTLKNEVGSANVEEINIHGKLNDVNNPIIFGFGDEMDLRYKTIEELNDNNYLEFIKSHRYLRTSNYKKLVNFIELGPFQTIILGHSCGLSDRVMLNMIFEHTNCKSILLYYHQFGEGYGGTNFSELVKNISRHFNKKDLMRQKVVEYELSERLPQL